MPILRRGIYHGAPLELARHGLVLAVALFVGLWWLTALSVDRLMSDTDAPLVGEVGSDIDDGVTAPVDDLAHVERGV